MGCEPFAYDTYHFRAMVCVGAVAERSNHRLLRCSSLRVPNSIPGFASVIVSIRFNVWVSTYSDVIKTSIFFILNKYTSISLS